MSILLKCEHCKDCGSCGADRTKCFDEGIKVAIQYMREICKNKKHGGGYWEGGGIDWNGGHIKGKFHYDKRANCDDCMAEIGQ